MLVMQNATLISTHTYTHTHTHTTPHHTTPPHHTTTPTTPPHHTTPHHTHTHTPHHTHTHTQFTFTISYKTSILITCTHARTYDVLLIDTLTRLNNHQKTACTIISVCLCTLTRPQTQADKHRQLLHMSDATKCRPHEHPLCNVHGCQEVHHHMKSVSKHFLCLFASFVASAASHCFLFELQLSNVATTEPKV